MFIMNNRIVADVFYIQLLFITATLASKKGVVHLDKDYLCGDFETLNGTFWWYDYSSNLNYFTVNDDNCTKPIDNDTVSGYVPMVWGWKPTYRKIDIQNKGKYLLGFNEPNHMKQSDLTPLDAAIAWKNVVETNAYGRTLVSPSAAPCGYYCLNDTQNWFDEFFRQCSSVMMDCRVDIIATHTYYCDAAKVMDFLEHLYLRYGKHIWLTEFACGKIESAELMLIFMKQILPRLENAYFVDRYFWYKGRIIEPKSGSVYVYSSASLFEPNSSTLTELGKFYNSYQGGDVEIEAVNLPTDGPSYLLDSEVAYLDKTGAQKAEVMAILNPYLTNPTVWWKILNSIKRFYNYMPWMVAAFYMTHEKKDAKTRIKSIFNMLLCIERSDTFETSYLQEYKIWKRVNEIRSYELVKGVKGLKVPKFC